MESRNIKEQLTTLLEELPEEKLSEVMDFVAFLLTKSRFSRSRTAGKVIKSPQGLVPANDPILKFIGMVDVEPFAENIDGQLYGEAK